MTAPSFKTAIAPGEPPPWAAEAVIAGGGTVSDIPDARALIWTGKGPDGLMDVLEAGSNITWIQLPSAGIESYTAVIDEDHTWTCAKGIYARPVAEHALALALAGLHRLPELARAHTWRKTVCRDLYDGRVTILGGGGITRALLPLLAPFGVTTTIVKRHPKEMPGATQVLGVDHLDEALEDADVLILALPLTPETKGIIAAPQLCSMKNDAWLVNVGRGKLVDTTALVTALEEQWIGGAALDVTDPEPLPDDHPLWDLNNCIVTPHCANPPPVERENYARLIRENVHRYIEGQPLQGLVDPKLGY